MLNQLPFTGEAPYRPWRSRPWRYAYRKGQNNAAFRRTFGKRLLLRLRLRRMAPPGSLPSSIAFPKFSESRPAHHHDPPSSRLCRSAVRKLTAASSHTCAVRRSRWRVGRKPKSAPPPKERAPMPGGLPLRYGTAEPVLGMLLAFQPDTADGICQSVCIVDKHIESSAAVGD